MHEKLQLMIICFIVHLFIIFFQFMYLLTTKQKKIVKEISLHGLICLTNGSKAQIFSLQPYKTEKAANITVLKVKSENMRYFLTTFDLNIKINW